MSLIAIQAPKCDDRSVVASPGQLSFRAAFAPFALFLLAVLPGTAPAAARPPPATGWDKFIGTWQPAPDSRRIIEASIRQTTEPMEFFIRGFARRRLLKRFPPPAWVRMERRNGRFLIEFSDFPPQAFPLNGGEVRTNNLLLRAWLEGGALIHTGASQEGTRKNVFRVDPGGGALTMETTVTSPRLPRPLHFTLTFTRLDSAR